MDTQNPKIAEVVIDDTETIVGVGSKVTLFNDHVHTFEEVTNQIVAAIRCSEKEAFKLAYMVDRNGSAVVFQGDVQKCVDVSSILGNIGLHTEITM